MKTTEPNNTAAVESPKPGNISTRDLAASLKVLPATSNQPAKKNSTAKVSTPAKTAATTPAREAANEAADETPETAETENVIVEGASNSDDASETAATAETNDTTDTAEETAAAEENAGADETAATDETAETETPPAKPELPEELRDAMALAKADGKKGTADLLKRVHKLVDERDTHRNQRLEVEEQNKQLRTELQAARNGGEKSSATEFAHPAVQEVQTELANVDHWIGFCETHLPQLAEATDVVEVPNGKGGKIQMNAAQLTRLQKQLERDRTDLVAKRTVVEQQAKEAWKTEYTKNHAVAVREYPWLTNESTPEFQELKALLQVFPQFKHAPDYELAIGDFIAGKKLREQRAKTKTNGTVLRKAPPAREPTRVVTDPPNGAATNGKASDKKMKESQEQFQRTGRTGDLAKSFAANRRASRT